MSNLVFISSAELGQNILLHFTIECVTAIHSNNQSIRNFVPNSLQQSLFATFVYDNGDHNAESLFGSSLHCTNRVALQSMQCRVTLRSTPQTNQCNITVTEKI